MRGLMGLQPQIHRQNLINSNLQDLCSEICLEQLQGTVKCPDFRLKPYFSQKQNCNIYFQRGLTVRDFLNILQSKLHHSLVVRFVVKHPAVANQGASG